MRAARSVVTTETATQQRKQPAPLVLSDADRVGIVSVLSNPNVGYGVRAGHFLRIYGPKVDAAAKAAGQKPWSARAKLAYHLIAGFVGVDRKKPAHIVCVPMKEISKWLGCSVRATQTVVRELVRSGPLPLLLETPGRIGHAGEYHFVGNPFVVAQQQAAAAVETRKRRNPAVVREQCAALKAEHAGVISPEESSRRQREAQRRRDWNTPTRPAVVVVPDSDAAQQPDAVRRILSMDRPRTR